MSLSKDMEHSYEVTPRRYVRINPLTASQPEALNTFVVPGYYTGHTGFTAFMEGVQSSTHRVGIIETLNRPVGYSPQFKGIRESNLSRSHASCVHFAISSYADQCHCTEITAIGYSLGGVSTVLTALHEPRIKTIILIAPLSGCSWLEAICLSLSKNILTRALMYLLLLLRWLVMLPISIFSKAERGSLLQYTTRLRRTLGFYKPHLQRLIHNGTKVYIIANTDDSYIGTETLRRLAKETGSHFYSVPGGHDEIKTNPTALCGVIRNILDPLP